jgi:hypothetical protein
MHDGDSSLIVKSFGAGSNQNCPVKENGIFRKYLLFNGIQRYFRVIDLNFVFREPKAFDGVGNSRLPAISISAISLYILAF